MLRHARNLYLFEVSDLDGEPDPGWPATVTQAHPAARRILAWARGYLSRSHPDVGRPGPVCPYVPASLRNSRFYVAVRPGRPSVAETAAALAGYRDWFLALERDGGSAPLTTILVLFPDVPTGEAPALIDATQRLLKPEYVEAGLMVGEFHPAPPDVPGLWNPDFRPLHSPVPLLAIRRMVANDLPFLAADPEFMAAYRERFGVPA